MTDAATTTPAVRVDGLTVRYGRTIALDAVSLDVPTGSVFALLGRNGSGKSSLVRCLLGQQKPEAGRLELLGQRAVGAPREAHGAGRRRPRGARRARAR